MSDEEDVVMSEEEAEEEEEVAEEEPAAEEEEEEEQESGSEAEDDMEPSGPSEAELAMKKKQTQERYGELDEESQDLLSNNAVEREKMSSEIEEMRKRSERRKKEREAEEKRLAAKRAEEEAERKAAEEERRRKKEQDELERKAKKLEKMAEMERLKNPSRPNFVITKKEGPKKVVTEESTTLGEPKKSKEQLEAEKQAILKQRIPALDIDGADGAKLKSKANELHALIVRLESEKYDLEKRFKSQQLDMMELAEKARSIHKATGSEAIKRVQLGAEDVDRFQEKFAGCPSKVIMFSEFERQKDKRTYDDKRVNFTGPVFADPIPKISPKRIIKWDENTGLPTYEYMEGEAPPAEEEE